MAIVFETERMVFRGFVPADLDDLARLYADEDVRRYFPDFTRTRQETARELRWFMQGGDPKHPGLVFWATELKGQPGLIGRGGLLALQVAGAAEVEAGWLLGRAHWRQGLGREMALGLIAHARAIGLPRLIALVDLPNLASAATARSAGMVLERQVDVMGPCHLFAVAL